jgi:hypothetical protein
MFRRVSIAPLDVLFALHHADFSPHEEVFAHPLQSLQPLPLSFRAQNEKRGSRNETIGRISRFVASLYVFVEPMPPFLASVSPLLAAFVPSCDLPRSCVER